jgi:hypothetical protein
MEEQQKTLLELVDRLQRRLDGSPVAEIPREAQTQGTAQAAEASVTSPAAAQPLVTSPSAAQPSVTSPAAPQAQANPDDDRYQDGIVIFKTSVDAKVPFMLRFNNNTQVRYLNTLGSDETFTDHLGGVREVNTRNDITVNRTMFILGGYIFD